MTRPLRALALTALALALCAGCSHREPNRAEVQAAISAKANKLTMTRVEVESFSADVSGSAAEVHAQVTALVDDGSFGASCRNVLGCYDKRHYDCRLTLFWIGGRWDAGHLNCDRE